jgi:hypothetical protein
MTGVTPMRGAVAEMSVAIRHEPKKAFKVFPVAAE